ncbi:hypothetical protein [Methylomagnum sp.]
MTPRHRNINPAVGENEPSSAPELVQQALRFLLMRYARSPSPGIAGNIATCVEQLLSNPRFAPPPDERCTYRHMRAYWRLVESLG